ncbi:hypothetical protein B0H17DRAFT_1147316 [Mycena rosella]|uniref:Uncharacterized protein n=1 Tax=Mycena rosella TaxID=1033263 RepID=A0AAD7CM20_MYCRO|nr:hypothetical protein B0H17DRAFT_1147316 [Mycena rosella]
MAAMALWFYYGSATVFHIPSQCQVVGKKEAMCVGISDIEQTCFIPFFHRSSGNRKLSSWSPINTQSGHFFDGGWWKFQVFFRTEIERWLMEFWFSSLVREGTVIRCLPTAQRGAALFIKYRVWRSDVLDEGLFVEYLLKNYSSWVKLFFLTCGRADMMLVTGVDVTTYFTTVMYRSAETALEENHETIVNSGLFIRDIRSHRCKIPSFTQAIRETKALDLLQPIADYIFSHSFDLYALFSDNDIKEMVL